ncbi:MAG: butyrate kinase, partial [Clostridia bacterium]|nr:butyrate kinase [Clostridia bacterium]
MKGRPVMTDKVYKIFTLSPGSTSTKLAIYENENCVFKANVAHDTEKLKSFREVSEQLPYRLETIAEELRKADMTLDGTDGYAAYCGALAPMPSGTYPVNEMMLHHATIGFSIIHPAMLGSRIIDALARQYGGQAFAVDPPDVDEYDQISRVTGLKDIWRESRVHALNQKETARRYAAKLGRRYEELNLIVAHMGGGVSVMAHRGGRMVDGNDCANGEGPMSANRPGALPALQLAQLIYSGRYAEKDMIGMLRKGGGFLSHLDTDDAREIGRRIEAGDKYAKLVYDAFAYQVAKQIGADAVTLGGKVDGIILTGGMANDKYLVAEISGRVDWIAPVQVYAGDFEMDALCNGALRVL